MLVLARLPGDDLVVRLLTSRPHGRPKDPPCYQGDPYPSFFLGVPGGQLQRESWVDLRHLDDFDADDVRKEQRRGNLTMVMSVERPLFHQILACVASAYDTTRMQEQAIRNLLSIER
jgi:hypothetical protein